MAALFQATWGSSPGKVGSNSLEERPTWGKSGENPALYRNCEQENQNLRMGLSH
jgi:hypothetical protein